MNRAYEIRVERGDNWRAFDYIVIASTDEEAVRKAKRRATVEAGVKTGWRTSSLKERAAAAVL